MTKKKLFLAALATAIAIFAASLAGAASASGYDYTSPDGACYASGWCHWSEVCYARFGGCYFNFWCPADAASPGQCTYYGGFAAFATAASSASGAGINTAASSASGGAATSSVTAASSASDGAATGSLSQTNTGTDAGTIAGWFNDLSIIGSCALC